MADLLYHYACGHSAKGIRRDAKLKPNKHPLLSGLELVWLTDLSEPDVDALGLTSHLLKCRRTEFRAVVEAEPGVDVFHWPAFARELLRNDKYRAGVHALYDAPGVLPRHWWVSLNALPVTELKAVTR